MQGYKRSAWTNAAAALASLGAIAARTRARRLVMSYSTDGLLTVAQVRGALERRGWDVVVHRLPQKRFVAKKEHRERNITELVFLADRRAEVERRGAPRSAGSALAS